MNGRIIDLRAAAARNPFALEGVSQLPDAVRASAIDTWHGRMMSEHASARVFASLLTQGMAVGLSHARLKRIAAFAQQELEHGVLCARALAALGGDPHGELDEDLMRPMPSHEDASALEGLLRNVLSISCLHETIAVSLVGAEREQVGPAELHRVFTAILSDEIKHAQFGWLLLDDLAPQLDDDLRERLGAYLVDAFAHLIAHFAPMAHAPDAVDEELLLGASDGKGNWELVLDTLDHVILPGLERHGIPARAALRAAA